MNKISLNKVNVVYNKLYKLFLIASDLFAVCCAAIYLLGKSTPGFILQGFTHTGIYTSSKRLLLFGQLCSLFQGQKINDCIVMYLNVAHDKQTLRKANYEEALKSNDLKQGMLTNKTCSFCNIIVANGCDVKCASCSCKFHIACIHNPLSSEVAQCLADNPCIWYTCIGCQHEKIVSHSAVDVQPTQISHDIKSEIAQHVKSNCDTMKTELTTLISETINSSITTQLNLFKNLIPSVHNLTPKSMKRKATDDHGLNSHSQSKFPRTVPSIIINDDPDRDVRPNAVSSASYASVITPSDSSHMPTRSNSTRYVPKDKRVLNKSFTPSTKEKYVLHFKPLLSQKLIMKEEDWPELRREISSILSSIKMTFSHFNPKSGKIVLGFPNEHAKTSAATLLESALGLWCYECYLPSKLLPKLTIHNVPLDFNLENSDSLDPAQIRDLVKDKIWQTIMDKNDSIKTLVETDHTLEVVYFKKHKFSCTVAIKVSPEIRSHIFDSCSSKVYMFSSRCNVTDRCYVKQCFHCQNFGHISKDCAVKSNVPTCMYCSGPHETKSCSLKTSPESHLCCNCRKSPDETVNKNFATHNAGAQDCPVLQSIISRIHQNTQLSSVSKNV